VLQEEFSSILSCIDKRTREGCDRGSEVGAVTADETGKGQFLRETEGIWQEKDFVSKKRVNWSLTHSNVGIFVNFSVTIKNFEMAFSVSTKNSTFMQKTSKVSFKFTFYGILPHFVRKLRN